DRLRGYFYFESLLIIGQLLANCKQPWRVLRYNHERPKQYARQIQALTLSGGLYAGYSWRQMDAVGCTGFVCGKENLR
ncbi:hypothetical protein, partial [Thiolapillus sp.]|uniref:hypothetical protein n=1 Tax=Thiolapillus sp. TaxID=2017437 RepID=UPI003AF6AC3B